MDSLKPEDIIQENESIPDFFFEYFLQENMTKLLDEALGKTCFFEYTETDSLGLIHCLLQMHWFRKEIVSLDEEKAYELCAS